MSISTDAAESERPYGFGDGMAGESNPKFHWLNSVVTRLVATLVVGGALLTVGLGVLELRRTESLVQLEVTQQVTLTTRNLQSVLRELLVQRKPEELRETLDLFTADARITAARVRQSEAGAITIGDWPQGLPEGTHTWQLTEHGMSSGQEINLRHPTLVLAPFQHAGGNAVLELLVDGPAVRAELRSSLIDELSLQWLFLAVLCLLGLLLVRRWFTAPLSELLALVNAKAGPEPFEAMGQSHSGEFSELARAIGQMLAHIRDTSEELEHRERAFTDLYQFAPAAMISLDGNGVLVEANERAARLFGRRQKEQLIGKSVMDLLPAEDRPLLRQTIQRLDLSDNARCEMRVLREGAPVYVAVECTGVRDGEQALQTVRLSLLDITESRKLAEELEHQSRLMNLIIDHMSDAILLVDGNGRIAASNQQLASLLQRRPDTLQGEAYEPETFWQELGVNDQSLFVSRMNQIEADQQRSAQERFETRNGVYLFQGIPVHDAMNQCIGKLWVVQETTPQEQSQRLLNQQITQLQAFKKLGQTLETVRTIDELLDRCGSQLYDIFGVEAVGVSIRSIGLGKRTVHVLNRGTGSYNLDTNQQMLEAVERHLMPQVLQYPELAYWPDLPRNQKWSAAIKQAGLTSLAAGPIRSSQGGQGILWIAQRGGEHLDRHHIYLVESLAQLIAARLEFVHLHEHLLQLEMTDTVTGLPGEKPVLHAMSRLAKRPGHPWSILLLNLDGFRAFCEMADHAVADQVLAQVGKAICTQCRRSNVVGRFEGATFAVIVPDMDPDLCLKLAERLQRMIGETAFAPDTHPDHRFTASISLAASPVDGLIPDELLTVVQSRLDAARSRGGNCIVAAQPHLSDRRQAS